MNLTTRKLLKTLGLPPMLLFWVLLMGLIFKPWLAWLALVLLYLLSISPVANTLLRRWEQVPVLELPIDTQDTAIVVLGGGMPGISPERPGFRPSSYTLERLRHGGWLQKQTGLPLLVSGGGPRPEAPTMAESLEQDFGAQVRWQESESRTTWENALFTRQMLPQEINTVVLVTHAWHMPRSILSFEKVGFNVIPAPTTFTPPPQWHRIQSWLPKVRNLERSEQAIRERIGYWYYSIVY